MYCYYLVSITFLFATHFLSHTHGLRAVLSNTQRLNDDQSAFGFRAGDCHSGTAVLC